MEKEYEKIWEESWGTEREYPGPGFKHRERMIIKLVKKFKISGNIIDVGCGDGFVLKRLIDEKNNLFGVDISKSAIEIAKKKFGNKIKFSVGSLENSEELPEEKFDLAICSEVLEHVEDDMKCIKNLFNILKSSGKLIVTVPHDKKYWSRYDEETGHLRRYSREELFEKLESAGFKILKIFCWGFPMHGLYYRLILNRLKPQTVWKQRGFKKKLVSNILYLLFFIDYLFTWTGRGRRLVAIAHV